MSYPPPPFLVYVMWHPESDAAASVAERVREHFESSRFRHVAGGQPMEVLFQCARVPGASAVEVAWDVACPIALVVVIDGLLAGDPEWVEYVGSLGDRAANEGLRVRMIPVVTDPSVLDEFPLAEQAIRWDEWDDATEGREARLLRELTNEFCRMLRHHLDQVLSRPEEATAFERYIEKIRVFLSYSNHDEHGPSLANEIRCWLHANSALASFLDAYDIPAGLRFPQVIEHHVVHSVMLAIYTDSYSSREWCRREVIEAKRHDVPMLVASCLHDGDDRAFPYLGNVPVVRMNPVARDRVHVVIARLLDEVLRDLLWRTRVEAWRKRHLSPIFMSRPPEFVSLAARRLEPGRQEVVVHPDPPLGDEESALLGAAWGGLRLLSMSQWLVEGQ